MGNSVTGRLGTIDALRGIAAFSVAWFHLTQGSSVLRNGWLKASGRYGWLGVEMFFVISGFIIPYSLHRANYRNRNFAIFLMKRIARLDPPYFANILLVILLSYLVTLAPGFHGGSPHYTWSQLACHLAYLNSVVGKAWVNPVFWSLGIEFQYYLIIGIIFPVLITPRTPIRLSLLALLLASSFLPVRPSLVFQWWPLFVAGILVFQSSVGLVSTKLLLIYLTLTSIICSKVVSGHGVVALVVFLTALIIRFIRVPTSHLTDVGLISYSLYLVHIPIGGKIMNLGSRFADGFPAQVLVLAIAVAASIGSASLFYWLIELPSQRLSSSVRYGHRHTETTRVTVGVGISHAE